MAARGAELVTVVIPAYNAEATIDETLRSVRAQTHENLEILVVDDGSKDETPAIVERHAAEDGRVRLIRQQNGGVARARNRAIEEAKGEFIAPVDADDLWRADKIERQLDAMRKGGEAVGLVYTWFALIDENSLVFDINARPMAEGEVLRQMCRGNLVGNGSSPLMRKAAVVEAGGYDPSLRDAGGQGCEDLQLYIGIAERWRFAVVPAFLTGYRQASGAMSGDVLQMVRSFRMVRDRVLARRPDLADDFNIGECSLLFWLYARSVEGRRYRAAARVVVETARGHPRMAARLVIKTLLEGVGLIAGYRLLGAARRRIEAARSLHVDFLTSPPGLEERGLGPDVAFDRLIGAH